MTAAITDLLKKTYNAANPNVARVTATRAISGTTLTCDNLAGWPTDTAVSFSTYKVNASNVVIAGTQIDWVGLVAGNNVGTLTRITGAADGGSAIGDVVEMNPTANWANDLVTNILGHANQDGTLKTDAATTVVIKDANVTTAKLADGAITPSKLASGTTSLGINRNAGAVLTTSYATFATLTATSTGRVVKVDWSAVITNGNSGASRNFDVQVLCDGVALTPASLNLTAPIASGEYPRLTFSYMMSSTPAAGSHTWALQLKASANSAVVLTDNYIDVTEVV